MEEMKRSEQVEDIWRDVPTLLAAAHELKSPLVLIRQLALQLQDQSLLLNDPTALRIRLTAERSLSLIEGLTRAARLEDALFECEPINIGELYDSIAHELSPLSSALSQTIEVRIPHLAPTVIGNKVLLRSVLMGLCDNALTHNTTGEAIVLTARSKGNDRVSVGVKDHGPRTDQIKDIKKRLGWSPQAVSARPQSSGLGLLIAEQFARHMDAHLSLTRHREAGVTFSLDLPKSRQLSLLEFV
ncbi:HAMP domain-containing histidine kinase [Pedobacter sp.]|nr:HAMP domain-containing histidine kinase [Candidatus Saccharibacteria bacterium]